MLHLSSAPLKRLSKIYFFFPTDRPTQIFRNFTWGQHNNFLFWALVWSPFLQFPCFDKKFTGGFIQETQWDISCLITQWHFTKKKYVEKVYFRSQILDFKCLAILKHFVFLFRGHVMGYIILCVFASDITQCHARHSAPCKSSCIIRR